MTSGCAPPGRVWAPGRSAGRSDSCASREPPSQDWLDNWQPRGIPCGPISSRVCKPHLNPARFAGVRVLGVDEHVWHHQDRRRRGPRELTGIVDLTRGEDHPTARLSGPGPGKVWHRVQELARRARRRLPCGGANRDAGSLPGTARTPSLGLLPGRHQRLRCLSHRQARWRRPR